jgi:aspartyl/asparaginyl beta-hydroxylase (cupin superfamily)
MNVRSSGAPRTADEQKVVGLMARVERLVSERRELEAQRLFDEAAAILPDHPLVLHERARRMALAGDPAAARALLERVAASAPEHVPFWLSLAAVLRTLALRDEEMAALERALALEPRHLVALLQKAALLDLMGKPRAAASVYGHALQTLAPGVKLPAPIEAHVGHARKRVADNAAQVAALLDERLGTLRCHENSAALLRFERCLDRMLGRKRIYNPEPTAMLFPFLRNYEFYARDEFPWLESLESATEAIHDELIGVLAADREGVEPYIAYPQGLPLNQWRELNHSRRWGAYFLWNEGRPQRAHMARCPRTMRVLSELPQVDIPGRGPTAFFSILEPRTRIPAHTGVTNARLTVHLPLIVPPGCRFRVGGETREWRTGAAWVFDDTIEHEAWNDSDDWRAILIFDVWNPQLTTLERDLVREATVTLAEYNAGENGALGSPAPGSPG